MIRGLEIFTVLLAASVLAPAAPSSAASPDPMVLEAKIPLGAVRGRIDHLAVDLARRRLFVAELGNGSLGVVDLGRGKLAGRIGGLEEPQGVAYLPATDTVYVASGGDGSLRRYHAADLAPLGATPLGGDTDNVRVDPRSGQVVVGHGEGALALVDAGTGARMGDIALAGHPESFQLEGTGDRIFANVPGAHEVAVVDRAAGRQVASWRLEGQENFPMALDEAGGRLLVVDRRPPELVVLATRDGATVARLPTCGDADDVFVDARRQRAYVACGEGFLAVIQRRGNAYEELARVPTSAGARTALFVPELDRLFLAVRAAGEEGAAVWVFRPRSS